jgi:hypothetical protein
MSFWICSVPTGTGTGFLLAVRSVSFLALSILIPPKCFILSIAGLSSSRRTKWTRCHRTTRPEPRLRLPVRNSSLKRTPDPNHRVAALRSLQSLFKPLCPFGFEGTFMDMLFRLLLEACLRDDKRRSKYWWRSTWIEVSMTTHIDGVANKPVGFDSLSLDVKSYEPAGELYAYVPSLRVRVAEVRLPEQIHCTILSVLYCHIPVRTVC